MRVVIRESSDLLARLQLDSLEGVSRYTGQAVQSGSQEVFVISVETVAGPEKWFLKRVGYTKLDPHRVLLMLLSGGVVSRIRREWDNYVALQDSPICGARPIAYGDDCSLVAERFSFLITAAAPGVPLDAFLRASHDHATRHAVQRALGRWVRKMHDAGIKFPDLLARHIFVDQTADEPSFCLIDPVRVGFARHVSQRSRAVDLAALHATLPDEVVSPRERMRFLHAYGHRAFTRLQKHLRQRLKKLAARGRYPAAIPSFTPKRRRR